MVAKASRGVAERAEGDDDRDAADPVVDDLVPDEDLDRVGANLAPDGELDDGLARPEEGHGVDRHERRVVDRRDPVLPRPARDELGERHGVLREVGPPLVGRDA